MAVPSACLGRFAARTAAATARSTKVRTSTGSNLASLSSKQAVPVISRNFHRGAISNNGAPLSSLSNLLSSLSIHGSTTPPHQSLRSFSSLQTSTPTPSTNLGEPITYLTLSNLSDNPGAKPKARRIGRGIGSSKGKTCGRGHKGQKSRAGKGVHPTFEGGQTKLYKRLPKVGRMKNHKFKLRLVPINVGTVQAYVTMGRLIPERSDGVITMKDFVNAGMVTESSIKSGVKLLGHGKEHVKDKLFIEVPWASASAVEAIEGAGGYVTTVHYNRLALRALLKPHKFPVMPENLLEMKRGQKKSAAGENAEGGEGNEGKVLDVEDLHMLPRRAKPPPKYMQYYTDYSKRGYLHPRVQLERRQRGFKNVH